MQRLNLVKQEKIMDNVKTDYTDDYLRYKYMKENGLLKEEPKLMHGLGNIVGKRILGFVMSEDKTDITFNDDEGNLYVYHAEAECCSYSWIEYIEDPEYLIGNTVLKVEYKSISEDETEDHECLAIMSYDIYTDKGICKIDFRNSSNGYYCGSLDIVRIESKEIKLG